MRCYELIELSAVIAVNAGAFIQGQARLPDSSISEYWSVSRSRFDRWARCLKKDWEALRSDPRQTSLAWRHTRPVLEEILTGEILTRVWTAVACTHDRRGGATYVSPVVRSVFLGHLEARNQALKFMLLAQDRDPQAILAVNRLRHRCERWTDMLLAYLPPGRDVAKVAFDKRRVRDFAVGAHGQFQRPSAELAWQLLCLALQSCFGRSLSPTGPNDDLNARIGSSVVACFRPERFDDAGVFDSLWMERLEYTTADAESLIEELLAADDPEDEAAFLRKR